MNNIIASYKHVWATLVHIIWVNKISWKYFRRFYILHDMDKVLLYLFVPFMGTKWVSKLHRSYSSHHPYSSKNLDVVQAICDWESARYTKQDKPLNARQTCLKYYSDIAHIVLPVLDQVGLLAGAEKENSV